MTDFQRRPIEPGPQPDPMLEPRRSSGWLWLFALAIVAVVFGTLYGINNQQESQTATNERAATESTGQNAAPQSPASGGRGTANAPKEQQAQGQTGKATTTGQGGQADQNNTGNDQGQQAPKKQ